MVEVWLESGLLISALCHNLCLKLSVSTVSSLRLYTNQNRMSKESNHLHYLTLIHPCRRCIPCLQWYRGKNNKQSDNYRLYHKACARGVRVSSKVTQAAQILAFLTFWVIQFVTLIIRADQHILGKCCSAESENSLHWREGFNQEAVAEQGPADSFTSLQGRLGSLTQVPGVQAPRLAPQAC